MKCLGDSLRHLIVVKQAHLLALLTQNCTDLTFWFSKLKGGGAGGGGGRLYIETIFGAPCI